MKKFTRSAISLGTVIAGLSLAVRIMELIRDWQREREPVAEYTDDESDVPEWERYKDERLH